MKKWDKPKRRNQSLAKEGQHPNVRMSERLKKINKGADPKKIPGKHGLVERITLAGLMPAVCYVTRDFRKANPDSSYLDLYKELAKHFPDYFPLNKNLYNGQNFSKQLNQSKEWQAAYWSGAYEIDSMLETRIGIGLYNDTFDNKDLVKLYDIVTKHKENEQILNSLDDVSFTMSSEDSNE